MAECSDGAMPLGTHMTGRIHDAGGNGKNFWVPRWEPHGSSGEWPDVHICRTFEGQLGVEKHADLQIEVGKGNQLMVSIPSANVQTHHVESTQQSTPSA